MYLAITVAALGYFVDIYDLILFLVVREPSLTTIGVVGKELTIVGEDILNVQMFGLLLGGMLWGILGDKKGRLSVLFGSIFLYSAANLLNGFVSSVPQYMILRFIAGIGLAGELGAGVTLVSEIMPKNKRGIGTTLIASFGLLGAVMAYFVADTDWNLGIENWRFAYILGGAMGFGLLLMRVGVFESGMYKNMKDMGIKQGDFLSLFRNKTRFVKYLYCILIGIPLWYIIGILVAQAPEFAQVLDVTEKISGGKAVMLAYAGISTGDLSSGLVSQLLKSRKKAVIIFLLLSLGLTVIYLNSTGLSTAMFYVLCFGLGFGAGYWAVFVTIAAEQFGTNIRATVATTVPNFVRGSVVPITLLFRFFRENVFENPVTGRVYAAYLVALFVFSIAFIALFYLEETFHKDLDFYEK